MQEIKLQSVKAVKVYGLHPGRAFLYARTQPNAKTYVSRLGYNTACTSYTGSIEIGRLSGSSLNRLYAKRKNEKLKKLHEDQKKTTIGYIKAMAETEIYENWYRNVRENYLAKQRVERKFSIALDELGNPIHLLSPRSKGKIRDKCTAFYRSCGDKKTFATLTFIEKIDDRTGVSILNKFFTQLRETFQKLRYIWVAERQPCGNIHFHIILNQRLPVREYNALWLRQQYNEGLRYNGEIRYDLNPFDIKKVKTIYALSWYLTKYITKNHSNSGNGFKCLAWHCSRSVSRLFIKTVVSRSCMRSVSSYVNSRLDKSTGEIKKMPPKIEAFYQLYIIENKPYFLPEMSELEAVNSWILEGMLPDDIPKIDDLDIHKFYNN